MFRSLRTAARFARRAQHTARASWATVHMGTGPARGALPAPYHGVASRMAFCTVPDATIVSEKTADADGATPASLGNTEVVTGEAERHAFQSETRQMLDIVTHSLYTDKEVFIRELISNASDALEKARHLQLTTENMVDAETPLEIHITVDEEAGTFTIQDTGVGMSEAELVKNLGTIAHSGTKAFVQQLQEAQAAGNDPSNLIGQFGVGFYASFMVGDKIKVFSQSALPGNPANCWLSDGSGAYDLMPADGVTRGTKIVIQLTDDNKQFANKNTVQRIVEKFSNFVGHPIFINGEKVNTLGALWTKDKNSITEEEHLNFYRYIAHAHDKPMFTFQFAADVPLSIQSLFYVPETHLEKFGMGKQEAGVSLFSRKVLIQPKCKELLPDWMRFVKGVVDSEDIPLNISRESMQDSALMRRLHQVLTKRFIKFLADEGKASPERFATFFHEFGGFLKEGVCTDHRFKDDLAKLLRFESSAKAAGELVSLDEYVSRLAPDQKDIYYLVVPNRALAESSPYYEAFQAAGKEVLFLYQNIDEFCMTNLGEYNKRALTTIESASAELNLDDAVKTRKDGDDAAAGTTLNEAQANEVADWMKQALSEVVTSVKPTGRLVSSPAVVVDHESASVRRMMRYVDEARAPSLPKQQMEINPSHGIIAKLYTAKDSNPELAKEVAQQVYDNALVAAGIMDDAREMLPRLNKLLEKALK